VAGARSTANGSPTMRWRRPCARWSRPVKRGNAAGRCLARWKLRSTRSGSPPGSSGSRGGPSRCPLRVARRDRTAAMTWRIGVDIGGTFTDVVLANEMGGAIEVVKVPTTPRDFAEGVVAGLRTAMSAHDVAAGDVGWLAHATTVVTNALLQGR